MKTVLLVDDHRLIFEGLSSSLGEGFQFRYAATLAEARTRLSQGGIDLGVLDLSLGPESGFDLLPEMAAVVPTFILTMHKSQNLVLRARDLGARGYFLKDESLEPLASALVNPLGQDFWISDAMDPQKGGPGDPGRSPLEVLTQREQQVYVMMAEGLNYKEIAFRLGISPKTVNIHRDNVMKKMGFESSADMVRTAIRLGLILA